MDKIAVLVPCYNESKTVAKVVSDFKRVHPRQLYMFTTTILPTAPTRSPARPAP